MTSTARARKDLIHLSLSTDGNLRPKDSKGLARVPQQVCRSELAVEPVLEPRSPDSLPSAFPTLPQHLIASLKNHRDQARVLAF